jgi:hypothetical protein
MLAFAVLVMVLAEGAVGLGLRGKLPGLPVAVVVFAILLLGAHLAIRRYAPHAVRAAC